MNKCKNEMDKVIGYTNTILETRFVYIRSQETNLSNFIADVFKIELGA